MQKTIPGRFFQQMCSSLTAFCMERDHMKDLRRYLALKYIQYLVLSSSNPVSTVLGLLGSAYTLLTLQSARVSSKATTVLIGSLAKADVLVVLSLALEGCPCPWGVGGGVCPSAAALARTLRAANGQASAVLLSAVALEAYLITFLPRQTRPLRTVSNARRLSGLLWALVGAECVLLHTDHLLGDSAPGPGPWELLLLLPRTATALLGPLTSLLGILLRIFNVYVYYKIFFSVSNRSRIKAK